MVGVYNSALIQDEVNMISSLVALTHCSRGKFHSGGLLHTYNKSMISVKVTFFVGNINTQHTNSFFVSMTNFT